VHGATCQHMTFSRS